MKKITASILTVMLMLSMVFTSSVSAAEKSAWESFVGLFSNDTATTEASDVGVQYKGHVQNIGDVDWLVGPERLGTEGQSLRLEAFYIELMDQPADMHIMYRVQVQNIGWMDWAQDGDIGGTTGKGLQVETVEIKLVDDNGDAYPGYSVEYRGHIQNKGDMPADGSWYADGEQLGTVGEFLRLEALEVQIVKTATDMTAYDEAVATAEGLTEANYTADSWAALQTALEENVVTEENTQAEVDAATAAINAAIDALVPVTDTALTVTTSMAGSASVARGQSLINVGTITLTANEEAVTVTGLKVTRSGLSADTDLASITAWDGSSRLNVPSIFSNGVATLGFTSNLVIPANSSKTIDVKANIAAAATVASQITLSLADESAIVTTADVNGTFPASSGTFTVANVTLGTLTPAAAADTASGNIYPGSTDEQSFAKFRITAANEGVKLTTVTFTQNGTAGDSDLSSLKLYNASGVQVGQTASISGRRVTFDISDANIVIGNGASTTLELRGIANASSAGRNVQFGIADATDLQGVGQTYGTTVIGTATPTANTLTAATGSLLVSLDTTNPAAATIGASSTSKYASFRVQAQNEPIQLRTIQLQLVAGTVAPNTLSNITLKVGDTVIGQVQNFFTTTVAGTENKTMTLTNPLTIATGQSVVIDVYGTTGTAVAGTYRMGLFAAADTISGIGTISGNTVNVNSGATGNLMTLGVQNITVNVGANTGATIFANGINQAVGTLNISHNLPGTVNVSTVGVTLAQGGGATASLTNLRLTDADGNVVSNTIGSPNNSGTNTLRFNSTVAVAQGATSTYKVVADVNSGATAGSTITVTPGVATAVTADTGETVATAAGSGSFIATVGATVATGDVTGATSVPGLVAGNVAAGATGVEIARGTLSNGGGENVILNKITLDAAFTGTGNLPAKVSNYVIKDAGGNVLATTASLASGTTEITLSTPLTITTITPQTIKIYADFASNADGGDTIAVAIGKAATDNYFYTGASTGVSEKTNGSNITSTTFTIAASKVSVTSSVVTDTTPTAASVGPGQTLASFTFKNEGTSTVVLKNVRLTDVLGSTTGTITNSNLSGAAIVQLRNSDWTVVGAQTGPLDGITDIDVVMAAIGSGNEVIIAAGESVTLYATISTQTTPTAIAIGNSSRLRVVAGTAAAGTSYTGTDGVTAYAVNNSVTSASTITWD